MDRILQPIIDAVLGLHGPVAYTVIGLLAFGEAAAFIGLVTPGEVSMVLGGVLATQGRVSLTLMLVVAAAAAVAGDSAGYWLGRRFGQRLLQWDPVADRFSDQIERTQAYFDEKGGRAVVIGRWVSFARTFVPFVAGAGRMRYRRFIVFSIPSAAVWAVSFVLLGYAAGRSWHVIERWSGPASLILLVLIAIGFLLRWAARRAAANQERIRELAQRVARTPAARWLQRRYGTQLQWLASRFDPHVARGLGLTLGFVVLSVLAILAGVILNDVQGFEDLAAFDLPVRNWFGRVTTEPAGDVARTILNVFRLPWLVVPVALVAVYAGMQRSVRAVLRVVVGASGAVLVAVVAEALVSEQVPNTIFPPVAPTVAAALAVHATATAGGRLTWGIAVRLAAVGLFVVTVVGVASLVTGSAVLSGVLFGATAGGAWAAGVEVQARLPFTVFGSDVDAPEGAGDVRRST